MRVSPVQIRLWPFPCRTAPFCIPRDSFLGCSSTSQRRSATDAASSTCCHRPSILDTTAAPAIMVASSCLHFGGPGVPRMSADSGDRGLLARSLTGDRAALAQLYRPSLRVSQRTNTPRFSHEDWYQGREGVTGITDDSNARGIRLTGYDVLRVLLGLVRATAAAVRRGSAHSAPRVTGAETLVTGIRNVMCP